MQIKTVIIVCALIAVIVLGGILVKSHVLSTNNQNRFLLAKKYVNVIYMPSFTKTMAYNLKKRMPDMEDAKIRDAVRNIIESNRFVEKFALKYAEFSTTEELNFLLSYYTNPVIIDSYKKTESIVNETLKKYKLLLFIAKNAFDNDRTDIDYTPLLYEEKPEWMNMMNMLLKTVSSLDDYYFHRSISLLFEYEGKKYPADKKAAFKQYLDTHLTENIARRIILNIKFHYFTSKELSTFYQFKISETSHKYEELSRMYNFDDIARTININLN